MNLPKAKNKLRSLLGRRDKLYKILDATLRTGLKKTNAFFKYHGKYTFFDQQKGQTRSLFILAGYKEYLWEYIFPRIQKYAPPDLDICIISPGIYSDKLKQLAQENGWSYLSLKPNKITLALNTAVKLFSKARLLYKIDEDIFLTANFFDGLKKGLEEIKKEGLYSPGFIAPTLNLNGFSYVQFLETLGLKEDFVQKFGPLQRASAGIPVHANPEAAIWLWEKSLPFDQVAQKFSSLPFSYSVVPHRFSIGAILMERDTWELFGDLKVPIAEMDLGYDEYQICTNCVAKSKVMTVCHNVFVGHFSFYPQEAAMRHYLQTMKYQLELPN